MRHLQHLLLMMVVVFILIPMITVTSICSILMQKLVNWLVTDGKA